MEHRGSHRASGYTGAIALLPDEIPALTRVVQGLAVYDVVAPTFYGLTIPAERQSEIHIRPTEKLLERVHAMDDRPLSIARPVDKRLVSRCRHFVLLLLGMLRAKQIPARARCGFGSYFNPPYFEDHWVCEYWNAAEARWILADPQIDEVWRTQLRIDHDVLNVPRDRFLVAADAWTRCRAGDADPARFGIQFGGLRGLWFVAGNLIRDLAALNKVEMLPWDVWGAQPRSDDPLDDELLVFFDGLAELTREPDVAFDDLRELYASDERVRVPQTVFNAIANRPEPSEA